MGNEPVVSVHSIVTPQVVIHEVPQPQPELLLENPPEEIIENVSKVEMLDPEPAATDEQNFLADIYNRTKHPSQASLKPKQHMHHRVSVGDRLKKNSNIMNKLVDKQGQIVSEGIMEKQNYNTIPMVRKSQSVVSSYQCTIEDCEDESVSSHNC